MSHSEVKHLIVFIGKLVGFEELQLYSNNVMYKINSSLDQDNSM